MGQADRLEQVSIQTSGSRNALESDDPFVTIVSQSYTSHDSVSMGAWPKPAVVMRALIRSRVA
jgi:hypothetical protein